MLGHTWPYLPFLPMLGLGVFQLPQKWEMRPTNPATFVFLVCCACLWLAYFKLSQVTSTRFQLSFSEWRKNPEASRSHACFSQMFVIIWLQPSWKIWVRQWEGWHPIYEMENKIHVPNHQPVIDFNGMFCSGSGHPQNKHVVASCCWRSSRFRWGNLNPSGVTVAALYTWCEPQTHFP